MGNKQIRDPQFALQIHQQINNLRADGDVQRRYRLVGDDHFRIQRQRPGNADALPLAAGKLVRVAPGVLRLQADALQQPGDPPAGILIGHHLMHPQRLEDRVADGLARVEGGPGILKNKLDIAAQRLQLAVCQGVDAPAVKGDAAALGGHQPQQRPAGGGLAAAGLAHQRQRFAGPEVEADPLHGVDLAGDAIEQAAAQREAGHQIPHLQHRFPGHHGILRRPLLLPAVAIEQREAARQIAAPHGAQSGHRRQQRLGIRMLRTAEDRLYRAAFNRFAPVHHQHAVGDIRHHAHIVGNKDHAHRHLFLQDADKLEDLRLNGDVQRGGRLIGDQQRRAAGERHGDHHPLAHAAGELVRIAL